jgi:hypothetical protein
MAKIMVERCGFFCCSEDLYISSLKNPLKAADGHPGIFSDKKYRRPALINLTAPGSPWTVPLFFSTLPKVFIAMKGFLFAATARDRILIKIQILTRFARVPVIILLPEF